MKRVIKFIFITLLMLTLGMCSQGNTDTAENGKTNDLSTAVDTSDVQVESATVQDLHQRIRQTENQVVLLNVWATWCQPCREEFPDLLRLYQNYRGEGFKLILVSADFPSELSKAKQFLAQHKVEFQTYLKQGDDMEFINGLHNEWSGALPATFIYDRRNELVDFWQGKASYEQLEQAVIQHL